MFQMTNLTASANQQSVAVLADGSSVTMTFRYRPAIQRWTVDVEHGDFKATAVGLSTNPNLLRLWRNVIPFGIQVATTDGTDPFLANDLDNTSNNARVKVNILDSSAGLTDVQDVEAASFQ